MAEQLIVSISREYGSGGHQIAEELAKRFSIPLYDRNLLDEIASKKEVNGEELHKYDEVPRHLLFSRNVNGYSNSPEEVIAKMQFDFLKEKAESGESFVVVGRCSEDILKDYDGLISFFLIADMDAKVARIQKLRQVSKEEAVARIRKHDKKRKSYHNYYCQTNWGDANNYDLTIKCNKLGIQATVDLLENFIRTKEKLNASKES